MTITPSHIATARSRLLRMHHESGVGHIGGNLSCLDAAVLLFNEFIGPDDRFVLSKGHSAGALYVALWSAGRLSDEDLQTFHKDGTLLAGHPPAEGIDEIIFATGSLGHGLSLAAGTALAWQMQNRKGRVFCMMSDGEWQEGSTWEALIFAQHHSLKNLTVLVDHNNLQGFGSTTEVASMSPLWERLSGFEIDIEVVDGHDLQAMRSAILKPGHRTRIIMLKTIKGHGVDFMEGRMEWHYLPLDTTKYEAAQATLAKDKLSS